MSKDHVVFMKRALSLALKARGMTSPNPLVGALVVKSGRIIGKGYHTQAGSAHAEAVALAEAGQDARGAVLYVTLEPCAHYGRTPPCVDAIVRSGVREVVVAMVDPNPLVNGKGISVLRQRRIKVTTGVLEEEARLINEPFIKYVTRKLPFITVKIAQSLDGKIATRTGDSKWITQDKARSYAHRLRQYYDAVMVGVNTVRRDNPRLDAWFAKRHPVKIVVDSQLSTPSSANIFTSGGQVILVTLPQKPQFETENKRVLAAKARILEVKPKAGQINLRDMMHQLARMGMTNILVEGGGTLNGSLFDEGLVDKVMFYISPRIIGGKDATGSILGQGIATVDKAISLKKVSFRRIGVDMLVEGYV